MLFLWLLVIPLFALTTGAHSGAWYYKINGKRYDGYKWWNSNDTSQRTIQRRWPSRMPLESPLSPHMACNDDGTPTTNSFHAEINAGDLIEAHYDKDWDIPGEGISREKNQTWPHYWGPTFVYLARCPDNLPCNTQLIDLTSVSWFKIAHTGLLNGTALNGTWGATLLYNGLPLSARIPSSLKAGFYLVRHEVIANHLRDQKQYYMQCAQLEIKGSGERLPEERFLVRFPGAYTGKERGLDDEYAVLGANSGDLEFVIPGPEVWVG